MAKAAFTKPSMSPMALAIQAKFAGQQVDGAFTDGAQAGDTFTAIVTLLASFTDGAQAGDTFASTAVVQIQMGVRPKQ